MSEDQNKISHFWQELKRRKVFQVVAMYAAAAFIILEVVDIVLPRLGLPDWTVTFVIILLIIGFPVSIIFSWIFDITPEGLKKTGPMESVRNGKQVIQPGRRILNLSNVIIAVLLIIVGILVYPKIFKNNASSMIKDSDGRISIAVMPFKNLTSDTLFNVWQQGVQNLIISSLSNSEELAVRQPQTMLDVLESIRKENYASLSPEIGRDIAQKLETNSFIQGNILRSGDIIRISAQLIDANSEEVYKTFNVNGKAEEDLMNMSDSLSSLLKNYLEIQVLEKDADPDVHSVIQTKSAAAYRYYIQAFTNFWTDHRSAEKLFLKALEIDSTILNAQIFLGWINHNWGRFSKAKQIFSRLHAQVDQYSYLDQLTVEFPMTIYSKDPYSSIRNRKQLLEYDSKQKIVWFQLGFEYLRTHQYRDAIEAFEKSIQVNQELGGSWYWTWLYSLLGNAYHELDNHSRENEIYKLALNYNPDDHNIIFRQAVCALSLGDSIIASELIKKLRIQLEKTGQSVPYIEYRIGWCSEQAGNFEMAQHKYRQAINHTPSDVFSIWSMNNLARMFFENETNMKEAMRLINVALETNSADEELIPELYHTRGLGFYKEENYSLALEDLNRSWELAPLYDHERYLLLEELKKRVNSVDD